MRLLYFCEKSQDTFYKRHMRPGGQGTKPALSFQQGTELFLLSTKSQRKEKKDIKGTPNHGHTFCRERHRDQQIHTVQGCLVTSQVPGATSSF